MSRQDETFTDEGTEAYLRMVEEIVREDFAVDATPYGPGEESHRDVVEEALKTELDLDGLEADLERADEILESYWEIASTLRSSALMAVIGEATQRTRAAKRRVRAHRERWG
jgi:hypothetical protein